jgi:hypothetical protein
VVLNFEVGGWDLIGDKQDATKQLLGLRAYGVSASALKYGVETITGVNPGKDAVQTKETGRVSVTPEIYSTAACGDPCVGGGSSDGEGLLICLLVVAVIMAVFTIVWTVVMVAFSILTIGGFLKKRYRTLLIVEKPNSEFMGKVALQIIRAGGVLEYPLNNEEYDAWMHHTFGLFKRLKLLRQVSLFFAFCWGLVEVGFKLNQILFNPADYNLWPFRYVMIAIFLPLLLYSVILEIQFKSAFDSGEETIARLLSDEPSFAPDHPMIFEEEPKIVRAVSTMALRTKTKAKDG